MARSIDDIADDLHNVILAADKWFDAARDRERATESNSRAVADAHREGWRMVARSIDNGFRLVAEAIRDNGRR